MTRVTWVLWVAAVIVGGVAVCSCERQDATAQSEERGVAVTIGAEDYTTAVRGEVQQGPTLSGRLVPEEQAAVRAEVTGPVSRVGAEVGQAVRKGTLLARVDGAALQEQLISARSAATSAHTALGVARRELERQQTLLEAGAVASQAVESARQAVTAAEAQVADARARESLAQDQIAHTTVRAPIAGIVSERPVNAGDVVQVGAALFTIVDPSSMRLEASVPAADLAHVKAGDAVRFEVTGYPDRDFEGHIKRISPTADPATGQVQVIVSLPNSGGDLVGGLFARGRVGSRKARGIVLPARAVSESQSGATATVVRNGNVQTAQLSISLRDSLTEQVLVDSGLQAGDIVLVGAAREITEGTAVQIAPVSPGVRDSQGDDLQGQASADRNSSRARASATSRSRDPR